MKYFSSVLTAINYHKKCPLCGREIRINDRDLADDYGFDYDGKVMPKLSFYLSQRTDEILTIDPLTNEVELVLRKEDNFEAYRPGGIMSSYLAPSRQTFQVKEGMFMHALHLNCQKCCQYSYTLQLHIDLGKRLFMGAYLNSESITVELDGIAHEIKNVYSTKVTHYSCFPKDGSTKQTSLPLIDLDLNNPQETINRIRKLLIFS